MDFKSGLHIGMRTIKTMLAVLILLLLYHANSRSGILLAAVSAIICMQDSMEKSFSSGLSRMLGTLLGALLGMLFSYVDAHFSNAYLNILMTSLGIMVIIALCNLLRHSASIVISCVVFLVIMLEPDMADPFMYSVNRLLDTFIGIAVAVAINRFIRRPISVEEEPQPEADLEPDSPLNPAEGSDDPSPQTGGDLEQEQDPHHYQRKGAED